MRSFSALSITFPLSAMPYCMGGMEPPMGPAANAGTPETDPSGWLDPPGFLSVILRITGTWGCEPCDAVAEDTPAEGCIGAAV